MSGVAGILLALPAHAVHDMVLDAAGEGVEAGVEEPLQGRFIAAHPGRMGPGIDAPGRPDAPDPHGPRGVPDVELEPAEPLVVEGFEPLRSLPADVAGPCEEMGVEPAAALRIVGFLRHQLDDRPRRRVDREVRPADELLRELEGREDCGARIAGRRKFPDAGLDLGGGRALQDFEGSRSARLEPVRGIALPPHAGGSRQFPRRSLHAPEQRHLPGPETGARDVGRLVLEGVGIAQGQAGLIRPSVVGVSHPSGWRRASNSSCSARRYQRG